MSEKDRKNRLGLAGLLSLVVLPWIAGSAVIAEDEVRTSEPLFQGLGSYSRPVTTDQVAAQRYFDQGLNFLFAFNHDEAYRSFRQAAEIDPNCAMAWWGVAYAQGPHINRPMVDEIQAKIACDALSRARNEGVGTSPVERALIDALALRHVPIPPEDRKPLDEAYAAAMRSLSEQFPDDAEIGVFTAESEMNLRPWDLYAQDGTPQPGTEEIVKRLEGLLEKHPEHPLALHLYIHAVEASTSPGRAENAANRLRDLQPGLSHNVHMPSHIDVRLGHWEQAEESNRKAIEADHKFLALREDPGFYGLYIAHNYHMLTLAAMMRGRSEVAIETIDAMIARIPEEWAKKNAAFMDGYLMMPIEVRMRFGRWEEILGACEPDEAFPLSRALRHYARAVSLAAMDQVGEAETEAELFEEARALVPETTTFGNNKAHDLLAIAGHLTRGEILYRRGEAEAAFKELREAVRLEDQLRYSEPPDWIQPVRHALGAALMKSDRFEKAEAVYREDLKRLPNNGWSLFGLARALAKQGKVEEAKAIQAQFEEVWKDSDIPLSSSCFCLPGI